MSWWRNEGVGARTPPPVGHLPDSARLSAFEDRAATLELGSLVRCAQSAFAVFRAAFPVAVDAKADGEGPATWVRVAFFGDAVATLDPRLTKGTEVYCEGARPSGCGPAATVTQRRGSTSYRDENHVIP